jgi:D-ribose pyranose/furanose isomerase RbsD
MERKRIEELLTKYNSGAISGEEEKEIEKLIEMGLIDLSDLQGLQPLEEQVMQMESPAPSLMLDERFHHMMATEKKKAGFRWKNFFSWPELAPRLAFASVTLIIGLFAGYFFKPVPKADDQQIEMLSQQVTDLKEMMMLSLLEKESATERLKAVSLTQEMDQASQKVTSALLTTLNNDGNVNVRLAALEALKPYVADDKVRQELIRSIGKQDSPLVQVALAELMAQLQVKSSVKELRKILKDERTPKEVKQKIQESIQVLI